MREAAACLLHDVCARAATPLGLCPACQRVALALARQREALICEHGQVMIRCNCNLPYKCSEYRVKLEDERRAFAERAEPLLVRARNAVDRLGWRRDDLDALLAEVREMKEKS